MSVEARWLLKLALDPLALTAWVLIALNLMLMRRPALAVFRWSFACATAAFIILASPFVANELQGWLEDQGRALATCAAPPEGSILVTLAGGILKDTTDPDDIVQMEVSTYRRTVAAARLALRTPGSLLLLSGGGGDEVREADLMASLATALGVAPDRIVKERESRTTFENALRTRAILGGYAGRPVYLVTSAMHMRRAAAAFRSGGSAACPYPVDFQRMEPEGANAVIPSMAALQRTADSLHELAGYEWYRRRHRAAPAQAPLTSGS